MSRIYGTKEETINFSASNQVSIPLNRNYHIQRYMCRLSVNHTNATAVFRSAKLLGLINSLQIVANGDETIKSIPAAKFQIGDMMASGNDSLSSLDETDGTKDSYVWFTVYMAIPNTFRPADTIFNTAVFSTLNMIVNWGSKANVGTGITINSAKIDVYSHALTNYLRNSGEVIKHYKETYLKKDVTVTSTELTIDLPTKQMYKSFAIVAEEAGVRSDAIINKITIKSGTTIIVQLDAQEIQAINYKDYGIKNSSDLLGTHIIDFLARGKMTDLLDTFKSFNTLEMVVDVEKQSGETVLHIYSDIIDFTSTIEKK